MTLLASAARSPSSDTGPGRPCDVKTVQHGLTDRVDQPIRGESRAAVNLDRTMIHTGPQGLGRCGSNFGSKSWLSPTAMSF